MKNTNGGTTWSVILNTGGTSGYFNGIVFSRTNPLIGVAQSDPITPLGLFYLAKTTDGGNNWFTQTTISGEFAIFHTIVCIDNLFYGWGTYPGPPKIVLTTDGGVTWNYRDVNLSSAFQVGGLAFSSDKTTGIASGNGTLPEISRSVNGGTSWSNVNTGITATADWCRMKWVYGTNTCYLTSQTGANGCAAKSTNGGANWTIMNTSNVTDLINIDLIYNGGTVYAYAIATDGRVIKLQDLVGIAPVNSNLPSEYRLGQNYPNPFNPATRIRFDISRTSFAKLIIYDIIGRETAVIFNEQIQSGSYEVEWDASSYPSGTYFYRLTVRQAGSSTGDYTETRKMILIK